LKPAVKAKKLTFVLPTEKHLVVSIWTFFKKFLGNQDELERVKTTKTFADAGVPF